MSAGGWVAIIGGRRVGLLCCERELEKVALSGERKDGIK